MKTIAEHVEAMQARQPGFRLVAHHARHVVWDGELSPFSRVYAVRIFYRTPLLAQMFTIGGIQPRVQVLEPLLERHDDYEQGPLPHVYRNNDDPQLPYLCLFSPEGGEWGLDDLIADTTVLWAARWLLFYEGWLATKKWKGAGRHPLLKQGKNLAEV